MSNTLVTYPLDGNSLWKHRVMPDKVGGIGSRRGNGASAPPKERPAAHQLVGGVKAHQGNDGYPA